MYIHICGKWSLPRVWWTLVSVVHHHVISMLLSNHCAAHPGATHSWNRCHTRCNWTPLTLSERHYPSWGYTEMHIMHSSLDTTAFRIRCLSVGSDSTFAKWLHVSSRGAKIVTNCWNKWRILRSAEQGRWEQNVETKKNGLITIRCVTRLCLNA